MHTIPRYGLTQNEVKKEGFKNIYVFMNQTEGEPMEMVLANTIIGLSRYVHEYKPDLIVVHGDRVEALAGAITGVLQNILVAHIEGGERSGAVDETIRHSVSKMSHIHFVANREASERLKQLGENPDNIFVIGSPDIDVMMSRKLPSLETVKTRYGITFERYAIAVFHPVSTELENLGLQINEFVSALLESGVHYVVIYPNNDEGCSEIFKAYKQLENNPHVLMLPSMRFEYFLTLLKNARFIVGNSSAGIREAPVYGVYTIDTGSRQKNRFHCKSILNVDCERSAIIKSVNQIDTLPSLKPINYFGDGKSTQRFMKALESESLWKVPRQKEFRDIVPALQDSFERGEEE
jgi:UDP-N-acetylglucosamine 2-epimerase (hydrolysing)